MKMLLGGQRSAVGGRIFRWLRQFDVYPHIVYTRPDGYAGVAELADAHDSNSCELRSCGFDSHLRHFVIFSGYCRRREHYNIFHNDVLGRVTISPTDTGGATFSLGGAAFHFENCFGFDLFI